MKALKNILIRFDSLLEVLLLIIILGVSIFFHLEAYSFSDDSRIYPLVTSGLAIILTVIYVTMKLYKNRDKKASEEDFKNLINPTFKRVLFSAVSFVIYLLAVYYFGFFLASIAYMISYPLALGFRKIPTIIIGVITVAVIILAFEYVLGAGLVSGELIELDFLF